MLFFVSEVYLDLMCRKFLFLAQVNLQFNVVYNLKDLAIAA